MRRALLLLGLFACADERTLALDGGGASRACPPYSVLEVQPPLVQRGAETEITIVWSVDAVLTRAGATLDLHDDIEVDVELVPIDGSYEGRLVNPFGAGAPSGDVSVLARGELAGCTPDPTRVTSFYLE